MKKSVLMRNFLRKYKLLGSGNKIIIGGRLLHKCERINGLDIEITGYNNTIVLTNETHFCASKIIIVADGSFINFATSPEINNLSVFVRNGSNQRLSWGKDTTITGGYIELCETGANVSIGCNCMIGWHISIVATDFHAVINKQTGDVLNFPGGVIIGDNCWLGHGVRILKSAKIANNTIVGAESVVAKCYDTEYTAIAGNPARVIKHNVVWDRRSPTEYNKQKEFK